MLPVPSLSKRLQLQLVALGYATLVLYGVVVWYRRDLLELQNPVDASGGMWAFGDELLWMFLFALFLVPTFFLFRIIRQSEDAFTTLTKVALAVSLTAPLCALLLALQLAVMPHHPQFVEDWCTTRLWRTPMVLVVLAMARCIGRRQKAKRLLTYALIIEGGTLVGGFALFAILARAHS